MARMISTSTYTAPSQAATLKALAQRQEEYSNAAAKAAQMRQIANPWQGAAQLMEVFSNNLNAGRAERQEAEGRQKFAQLLSGVDPTQGATPEQIQQMYTLDPDQGALYAADAMKLIRDRQAAQAARSEKIADQGTQFANQRTLKQMEIDAAAAKVDQWSPDPKDPNVQVNSRTGERRLLDSTPDAKWAPDPADPNVQVNQTTGERKLLDATPQAAWEIDPTNPKLQINKTTGERKPLMGNAGAGTDRKALWDTQDTYVNTTTTQNQLKRARDLLTEGINTGYTSGARTAWGAAGLPGGDEGAANRTKEYNSIMNQEAILAMSDILKGATSNQEMTAFVNNMNDPTLDPVTKGRMIDTMLAKVGSYGELQRQRITELGGEVPAPVTPLTSDKVEAELQQARDAIAKGAPAELVKKRLSERGVDPGKL
jgi:hypothetical protein